MCPSFVSGLSGQLYGIVILSYSFTALSGLSSDIYVINWEGKIPEKNEEERTKAETMDTVAPNSA